MALLISLAFVFRFSGAAVRTSTTPLSRLVGWWLCAVAAWLAGAAAGGFAPIGLALVVGTLFSLLDRRERRWPLFAAGDIAVVVACGYFSIPPLTPTVMVSTAVAVAVIGGLIDRVTAPRSRELRGLLVTLPVLLWIGFGLVFSQARAEFKSESWAEIRTGLGPLFAVSRADFGRRVELETGAVAWLTQPSGPPPYRGALFFHGRSRDGSDQRSGLFLQRTLVSLGYAVLAIDQPGFGDSPLLGPPGEMSSFDPRPSAIAAVRYLEALPEVEGSTLVVGHSMGAASALRFLEVWLGASAGVILGATVMPPAEQNETFYANFNRSYVLETGVVSREFVLEVRSRYFNNDLAATSLREGHAPVLFVRYMFEHANIIEGRDELFAMIPGRTLSWEVRTDHQMASGRFRGVMTGNWGVMRDMRRGLGAFVEGISPVNGDPLGYVPR